jgi:hypothetical protein
MGLQIFTIDWDVIKKEKDKMMYKGLKYVIHETLEVGWCITKNKQHH